MENILKILGAGMPIIGILVGAAIQSYYSKRGDTKKQALAFKSQAYIDYLKCLSESAHVDHLHNEEIVSIFARAADAKTRIAIFGSKKVAECLAAFVETGETLDSSGSTSTFLALCSAMREDYLGEETTPDIDSMISILIGVQKNA